MRSILLLPLVARCIENRDNRYMYMVHACFNVICLSPISNVHRDTSSVDYITITYNYNN